MRELLNINIIVVLACLVAPALAADTEAIKRSWIQDTADGKSQFVMLGPPVYRNAELKGEWDCEVPAEFVASGLYPKGNHTDPVYRVDWYAYEVDLSFEGRFAVRHGLWPESTSDFGVGFYDNGKPLQEYQISDLIITPMPWDRSRSHFQWNRSCSWDPSTNQFELRTRSLGQYRFDATTGEIISSFRGDYLVLAGLAALFGMAAWWTWRKRRDRNRRLQR